MTRTPNRLIIFGERLTDEERLLITRAERAAQPAAYLKESQAEIAAVQEAPAKLETAE